MAETKNSFSFTQLIKNKTDKATPFSFGQLTNKQTDKKSDLIDFFPAKQSIMRSTANMPLTPRTPSTTEKVKEFFLPTRGYTEEQLYKAQPTTKESIRGAAKVGGEIVQGTLSLGHMLGNTLAGAILPGYDSKSSADARNKVLEKTSKYLSPTTVGEAKAMRMADIATIVLPVKKLNATKALVEAKTEKAAYNIAKDLGIKNPEKTILQQIVKISDEKQADSFLRKLANDVKKEAATQAATQTSKPFSFSRFTKDATTKVSETAAAVKNAVSFPEMTRAEWQSGHAFNKPNFPKKVVQESQPTPKPKPVSESSAYNTTKLTPQTIEATRRWISNFNRKDMTPVVLKELSDARIVPDKPITLYRDGAVNESKFQSWSKVKPSRGEFTEKTFTPDEILLDTTDPRFVSQLTDGSYGVSRLRKLENEVIIKPASMIKRGDIGGTKLPVKQQTPRTQATSSFSQQATEKAGAFDIKKLSKTRQDAIKVYPELASDAGLEALNARTRGTVSHQQAIVAAERLGWSEEKMLNMPVGKALSDTELMAARGISQHADNVLEKMKNALSEMEPFSPEADKMRDAIAIQKVKAFKLKTFVVGASTEAGRALSSLRAVVNDIDGLEKRLAKLYNDEKTPQHVKDFISERVGTFDGTPEDFVKLLRELQDPTVMDMIVEFATAIKLTTIPTHVVNFVTGLGMLTMRIPERLLASGLDAAQATLTGAKRERFLVDVKNEMVGQAMGWKNAGREAARAMADEDYAWQAQQLKDFSLSGPKIKGRAGKNELSDRFLNTTGKVVRTPFRLLGAEDMLLRQPSQQGARYVAIGRMAIKEGFEPGTKEYAEYITKHLSNPTADIVEESVKAANRSLFQDELPESMARLQQYIADYPVIKFVVPFFKTIVNLQKRALEYSPLAPILPSVRKDLAQSGTRADALSRMTIGSAAMIPLTFEAMEGNITLEAPKNPAERDAFFAEGKQAYSIKIGDQWVPFARLSPFSEWFVTAGLMAKAIENEDEDTVSSLAADTFFGLSANMFDKSFATGIADLLDALRGEQYQRDRWLQNFVVGSTYPALLGNIARSEDPVIREVNSIKDAYLARTPFLSESLPARKDVFGEDIVRSGSTISRLLSPVIPSQARQDMVRDELKSLGITMGFPDRKAGGFDMTDEQYRIYQEVAGNTTYDVMSKLIMSPEYQQMSPQDRENIMNRTITEVRSAVKTKVATDLILLKEIQDRLEKSGLTSEQAKEKAPEIFSKLKQGNNPTNQ